MAVFYVLPPRSVVGVQISKLLQNVLPGFQLPEESAIELLQSLVEGTSRDVYLVHREDLSDGDTTEALCDGFGAEAGDRIVQVSPQMNSDQPKVRTWIVEEIDTPVRVAAFV